MTEVDPTDEQAVVKRKSHWLRNLLIGLFLFLAISFFSLFAMFNYYGDKMLRQYLQEKILVVSNGVYRADFKKLNLNILTGKVSVDSFELFPDTVRYNLLKKRGSTSSALYRVSLRALAIDRVHFWQIYRRKRINFTQLVLQQPIISIISYPDTVAVRHQRWRVIYEDIYPAVSGLFNDFHIDSVKVNHGLFLGSFRQKTGKRTEGEYEFSSILKDVSVNPFSYYNKNRVFYSREVDLVIHNFDYVLTDSLYTLKAKEIGFSLTRSNLYGKKISLIPDRSGKRSKKIKSAELFRFDLPAFSISGINLYRVLTDKTVDIDSVMLTNLSVKVYRNEQAAPKKATRGQKAKINLAGLYPIVARELRYIRIDTLSVKNGYFAYYGAIKDRNPELSIGKVDVGLSRFLIDSLSYSDKTRIFYSKSIELAVEDFSLNLRDGIHFVNAASILFSTRKSQIDVHQCLVYPDRKKNLINPAGPRNLIDIKVPRLTFSGIDLKKVFNRRILDFDSLKIRECDVSYTKMHASKNPDPRFRKAEDFFEEKNEDVIYDLLKSYLWVIRGTEIEVENSYARISVGGINDTEIPLVSGNFNLTMNQFLIDSLHGMNQQGYFYSTDFDLDVRTLKVESSDSSKLFTVGSIHVNTSDSLIEAENLHVIRRTQNQDPAVAHAGNEGLSVDFVLKKLHLTGLNHKRLFLENVLKADLIILEDPNLRLRSGGKAERRAPVADTNIQREIIRSFEIGKCVVNKGTFSYDGTEDRRASYFSMKDIDFSIVNATVRLPEKGNHNGLIQFDSLQLKVFPLRAVLADSTYAFEVASLNVGSYPMDITLKGTKVTPLRKASLLQNEKRATLNIPEIRVKGFYFDRALFEKQWSIDSIIVSHPIVGLELKPSTSTAGQKARFNPDQKFSLPVFMKNIDIAAVRFNHAEVGVNVHGHDTIRKYAMREIMLAVEHFHIDSASVEKPPASLFYAEDISIATPGISMVSADSLYTLSFGRFGLSTRSACAVVDSIAVVPNFTRQGFAGRLGYQTTIASLKIPRLDLLHIDLRKLLTDHVFHVQCMDIPKLHFEAYLDKRLPDRVGQKPPMPQQVLHQIKFPFSVDSLVVHNGRVVYEEQSNEEPGRLFFDRMKFTITGLCDSADNVAYPAARAIDVKGSTYLMGKGRADAWFRFFPDNPRDSFTLAANIAMMELRDINPMMSKLIPISIHTGSLNSVEIKNFNASDSLAVGEIDFRYNNLAIKLHPTKPGTWPRIEQGLLTELVNMLIPSSNPRSDGKIKTGVIYYKRDLSRGFFNFVWKSILSGIKSSVGVETKEQKKTRKKNR